MTNSIMNLTQSVVMLSISYAECHKSDLYAEWHYAECLYADCNYAECRGAVLHTFKKKHQWPSL
jgi:hypothetical protein